MQIEALNEDKKQQQSIATNVASLSINGLHPITNTNAGLNTMISPNQEQQRGMGLYYCNKMNLIKRTAQEEKVLESISYKIPDSKTLVLIGERHDIEAGRWLTKVVLEHLNNAGSNVIFLHETLLDLLVPSESYPRIITDMEQFVKCSKTPDKFIDDLNTWKALDYAKNAQRRALHEIREVEMLKNIRSEVLFGRDEFVVVLVGNCHAESIILNQFLRERDKLIDLRLGKYVKSDDLNYNNETVEDSDKQHYVAKNTLYLLDERMKQNDNQYMFAQSRQVSMYK